MNRTLMSMLVASALCAAPALAQTTDLAGTKQMLDALYAMQGKTIVDQNGQQIGRVVGIDDEQTLAIVQTPSGNTMSMSADMLMDKGDKVALTPDASGTVLASGAEDQGVDVLIPIPDDDVIVVIQ